MRIHNFSMIPKGNQRGGGQQLATHLMNAYDNERVEVAEVRGSIAEDVHGAFAEWSAQAKATRCEKYLYSLSVNPDQRQGRLSREQYLDFLTRVEKHLGLENQARVVVFHHKVDRSGVAREHCHAVWSRINADAGRAVQMSHDRMKLRTVVREFALEHGLELPAGLQKDRGKERYEMRTATANLQEKQQEERTGISKEERRAAITKIWCATSNGEAFVISLQNHGYRLARGDSRSYVVVDRAGEIHSLSRQLAGVKTAELKARLSPSHGVDVLPTVAEVRALVSNQRQILENFREAVAPVEITPESRRQNLMAQQAMRREPVVQQRLEMQSRHDTERHHLEHLQHTERQGRADDREANRPRGMSAFIQRITGIRAIALRLQQRQDTKLEQQHQQQNHSLQRRHKAELAEISRKEKNLTAIETRERRSLETKLKRDVFQKIEQTIEKKQTLKERFHRHASPSQEKGDGMTRRERRESLHKAFYGAASPDGEATKTEHKTGLGAVFSEAAVPATEHIRPDPGGEAEREAQREASRLRELERLRQQRSIPNH